MDLLALDIRKCRVKACVKITQLGVQVHDVRVWLSRLTLDTIVALYERQRRIIMNKNGHSYMSKRKI